jgi:hypothetical protein
MQCGVQQIPPVVLLYTLGRVPHITCIHIASWEKKSLNEFSNTGAKLARQTRLRGPKAPRNLFQLLGMTLPATSHWLIGPAQWGHHRAPLTGLILADWSHG